VGATGPDGATGTAGATGATGPAGATGATGPAIVTTKGDLATFSTTIDRLPVGTNGQALIVDSATSTGLKWDKTLNAFIFISPEERWTVSATAATGTIAFDASTQGALYYTTNASGNWTLNVRGDSGTTLNSVLNTGDTITVAFLVTNGATAYYQTAFQIDGSAVTPKYSGGTAPSAGNASSIDSYIFTIIKTANATFTVLGAGPIKYA
jgi:hypothetical protein